MKITASIILTFFILFSGIRVNIASHYCGGSLAATKVSLSGELATCGMEDGSPAPSAQDLFTRHCCTDKLSSFTISTIYLPAECSVLPNSGHEIIPSFLLQNEPVNSQDNLISLSSGIKRPPGVYSAVDVKQQIICIFRI
jgi:hypothetical protein